MISQTAEYALRAVVCLVTANGVAKTRQELSDEGLIPVDYLTRVMQKLSEHDIVSIKRGPGGGYQISQPVKTLTVLDVVSAVEPLARIEHCPLGIAEHEALCPLHAKLDEAAALVEAAFQKTRIIDLVSATGQRSGRKQRCSFPPTDES